MGSERFEAPEALFQPHLVDVESGGMAGKRKNDYGVDDVQQDKHNPSHPLFLTCDLPLPLSTFYLELLFNCIQSADIDVRPELYKNIVLSGGSSMYPGLPSRLEKEVKQLYLSKVLKDDVTRLKVKQEVISISLTLSFT